MTEMSRPLSVKSAVATALFWHAKLMDDDDRVLHLSFAHIGAWLVSPDAGLVEIKSMRGRSRAYERIDTYPRPRWLKQKTKLEDLSYAKSLAITARLDAKDKTGDAESAIVTALEWAFHDATDSRIGNPSNRKRVREAVAAAYAAILDAAERNGSAVHNHYRILTLPDRNLSEARLLRQFGLLPLPNRGPLEYKRPARDSPYTGCLATARPNKRNP